MATKWTSPVWRMPENSNQSKLDNYSLDFNGSDEFINFGNSSLLNFGNGTDDFPFSLSIWFYRPSTGSARILAKDDEWELRITSGNSLYLQLNDSSNGRFRGRSGTFTGTGWHHIAATYDGRGDTNAQNGIKIYVDGVKIDDTDINSGGNYVAMHNDSGDTNLARLPGGTGYTNGDFSQLSVFDYELSETQVKYLYNNNAGGSTPNPQNPMAIAGTAPIAYYPLGGSSTGSSSTLTIPNESGSGDTVFDFVPNDAIDVSNDINITSNFSCSFWYRSESSSGTAYEFLLSRENAAATVKQFGIYNVFTNGSGRILANIFDSGGGFVSCDTGGGIAENTWHHIAFCYSPSNYIRLYLDGVLDNENTTNIPSSIRSVTGESIRIGGRRNNTMFLNGQMSNVQIWSGTLTDGGVSVGATAGGEVATLYNGGRPYTGTQPQAANLKGWWKMNVDTSSWDGSDWIIGEAQANYTSALKFNNIGLTTGNLKYLEKNSRSGLPTVNDAYTISTWARAYSQPGYPARNVIFFMGQNGVTGGTLSLEYGYPSGGGFGIYLSHYGVSAKYTSTTLANNIWHHFAITHTDDGVNSVTKLFLNGQPLTPDGGNFVTGILNLKNNNFNIGSYLGLSTGSLKGWDGEISNFAIFNSVLSDSNIETLYNNGTPESSISFSPLTYYKLDNSSSGIQDSGSLKSNNLTNVNSVDKTSTFVSTLNGISSGMTTANLVTSDLNRSLLYSSYSMDFEGTNDKITLNSNISTGDDYSVSFWLNPDNISSGNSYIFSDSTTSPYKGLALDQGSSSAGGFGNFYYYTGSVVVVNNTAISGDSWSHIVITFDVTGQEIKFYVNGVLDKTTTSVANIGTLINEFGTRTAGNYFNGKLSNISVFNKALSENEILTIYNGGAPNDISSLSPVGWWSLSGDSYFASNWICPDLSANSNNGTSNGIPVTALVGNAPGSTGNGTGTSMNIPGNLEGNAPNSDKNAYSVNMVATNRGTSVPNISS
jgi:hypothetical protein